MSRKSVRKSNSFIIKLLTFNIILTLSCLFYIIYIGNNYHNDAEEGTMKLSETKKIEDNSNPPPILDMKMDRKLENDINISYILFNSIQKDDNANLSEDDIAFNEDILYKWDAFGIGMKLIGTYKEGNYNVNLLTYDFSNKYDIKKAAIKYSEEDGFKFKKTYFKDIKDYNGFDDPMLLFKKLKSINEDLEFDNVTVVNSDLLIVDEAPYTFNPDQL